MPAFARPPFLVALLLSIGACGAVCAQRTPHPAQPLVERSIDAMRHDPDLSRRLAEDAIGETAERADADLEVRARLVLCDHLAERDRAAAEAQVAAIRAALPRLSRRGLEAGFLACQGEIHENAGDNAQALRLFEQAVATAERHGDDEMLADTLYQRGYLRGLQGDFGLGLLDLRRSRSTYERLGMAHRAGTALNGIAILYNRMGDHAQARHYYEQTLKAQTAAGARREMAVTQHNLGRVHENLKDWAAAARAFAATLDLSREIGYQRGEAYALRGLASVRNAEGDPAGALHLLQLAELLAKRTPDERLRAQILLQRAIALRASGKPADALPALEDALRVFARADALAEVVATRRELAAARADLGQWQQAYGHHRDHAQSLEQWLRGQIDQRFATLKVEFDTAAKERENAMLLREQAVARDALAQAERVSRLQVAVIVLVGALVVLLGVLMLHQRRAAHRMRTLAMTDELTGLPNRRDVLARLGALLAEPRTPPCALLIVDLDHFKSINDEFGHLVGDEMLKAVADVLREAVREPVFLGRLGGEEFVVVLPATGEAQALKAAERIREQVEAIDPGRWLPGTRRITASLGVTVSRPGEDDVGRMLQRADEALYRAKGAGRNRVYAEAA